MPHDGIWLCDCVLSVCVDLKSPQLRCRGRITVLSCQTDRWMLMTTDTQIVLMMLQQVTGSIKLPHLKHSYTSNHNQSVNNRNLRFENHFRSVQLTSEIWRSHLHIAEDRHKHAWSRRYKLSGSRISSVLNGNCSMLWTEVFWLQYKPTKPIYALQLCSVSWVLNH